MSLQLMDRKNAACKKYFVSLSGFFYRVDTGEHMLYSAELVLFFNCLIIAV